MKDALLVRSAFALALESGGANLPLPAMSPTACLLVLVFVLMSSPVHDVVPGAVRSGEGAIVHRKLELEGPTLAPGHEHHGEGEDAEPHSGCWWWS